MSDIRATAGAQARGKAASRTLDEEYEICQERGHTPKPRPLMAPPVDAVETCAYCGTRYWTVTEVREERPAS